MVPNLKCDLGMCLVIVQIKDDTDEARNNALSKTFVEQVGLKCNETSHASASDSVAKVFSIVFNHDEDISNYKKYLHS